MKAERLAEAERLRARGREAAQRIRARADREVVEIVAEARKESEILRGEGEAERNAIFADAFQRDPEFFEFYRSMNAYAHGAGRHGHDDGAVAGFGVLPLLPRRRAARRRRPRRPSAAGRPAPRRRDATDPDAPAGSTAVSDFLAAMGLVLVSRAWSMAAFRSLAKRLGDRGAGDAGERAAHRRAGGDRGRRRHRLAGARVTEDLSSLHGQGRKHALFLAEHDAAPDVAWTGFAYRRAGRQLA